MTSKTNEKNNVTFGSSFIIDSLPRVGSTSVANMLNAHPDIRCAIEPFHPQRNRGDYLRIALSMGSVKPALELLHNRWTGIKHVWEPKTDWPFTSKPELNKEIVLVPERIVLIERRNLLRRYVSHVLCRRMNFWIGTKKQFEEHLHEITFPELDVFRVISDLKRDLRAIRDRESLVKDHGKTFSHIYYEDFFGTGIAQDKRAKANGLFSFLGFREITSAEFEDGCSTYFDDSTYQWASEDTYRRLPQSGSLDRAARDHGLGYLFL